MAEKIVNIGGASGAWGDSPMAIPQLLTADVHYLMMDYLAEVTMSLLARARMKDANAGFPPDFVAYLKRSLPEIAKRGIKVVSNGGGVNPGRAAFDIADDGRPLDRKAILTGAFDDRVEVAHGAREIEIVAILGDALPYEAAEEVLYARGALGVGAGRRQDCRRQGEETGQGQQNGAHR